MFKKLNHPFGHWLLLILVSIIWGSSFILMKRGLDAFSYEQVASLRLFIAFLFLAIIGRKFYQNIPKKKLGPLFIMGIIGNGIPAFLFTKSETFLDSGIVGILNVLTPIFTVLIGLIFYNLKAKVHNYIGITIGLLGVVHLLFPDIQEFNETGIFFSFMVILATVCYGWSTNIIKVYLQELNPIQITTLAYTFIGPWAGIYLFCTDFVEIMQYHPKAFQSLGYTLILGIFSSAISVIIFNKLIQMRGPLFATSCTYIIPIIAISWGLIDNETIGNHHLSGFAIISVGIYLVNKRH